MPVTDRDACSAGRAALGTPKVLRRVTLEGYRGVSYERGGRAPEFMIELTPREVPGLRGLTGLPDYTLLNGRVHEIRVGREADEVVMGMPSLEATPASVPGRLGVGAAVGGYWARVRGRFSIAPTPAR